MFDLCHAQLTDTTKENHIVCNEVLSEDATMSQPEVQQSLQRGITYQFFSSEYSPLNQKINVNVLFHRKPSPVEPLDGFFSANHLVNLIECPTTRQGMSNSWKIILQLNSVIEKVFHFFSHYYIFFFKETQECYFSRRKLGKKNIGRT